MYCNVCNKYRKSKETKISYILKKTLNLLIFYSKCSHEYKIIFKEEQSVEILQIHGLINTRQVSENILSCLKKIKSRI